MSELLTPVPASGQVVVVTTTSNASTTISGTIAVRLLATTDCFISVGVAPVAAVNTGMFLKANIPETIKLTGSKKVAVIRLSADGSLYISNMV